MARVTKMSGRVFEDDGEKLLIYHDFDTRQIVIAKLEELNAEEAGERLEKMIVKYEPTQ